MPAEIQDILSAFVTSDTKALGASHACSACHAMWRRGDEPPGEAILGFAQLLPNPRALPALPIFDIASITKALVPATLAMIAVDRGLLELDALLVDSLPEWCSSTGGAHGATLRHLLAHGSGLPAWHKYYEEVPFELEGTQLARQRAEILQRVLVTPKLPANTAYAYSDLGYMALMVLLERAFDEDLDVLARDLIFAPLELSNTRYVNRLRGDPALRDAVTTEVCSRRGAVTGVVHDENTYVIGGVSGHAGVFSTARDLFTFCEHMLAIDKGRAPRHEPLVRRATLHEFWDRQNITQGGHHVAGWDTPSGARTSAGRGLSREHTVGHLGFTGTSIWIDRAAEVIAVLLTNRVHPTRENPKILDMRIAFHEAVAPPR